MFERRKYLMKIKNLLFLIASFSAITILSHLLSAELNGLTVILHALSLFFASWYAIKSKSLTAWIMVCMFMGIAIGLDLPFISLTLENWGLPFHFPSDAKPLRIFSDIFLRLIKTIIAPLLLATLVVGIAGHSNIKQVGRMGLKAIGYFEVVTTLALIVGLLAINISGAGWGTNLNAGEAQVEKAEKLLAQKQSHDVILDIFPENIAKSVADNQILQIVLFSILFGIGLAMVKDESKKMPVLNFMEGLSETMFKFTNIVMWFAPLAVGGAMAYSVAGMGLGVIGNLLKLVGTLYVALFAFLVLVLLPIALLVKLPFKKFLNTIYEPVSIAFATASSEAALPKAMENLEAMGIPRKVVAFVLPTGYSFNLDGTTLYLSLASVFIAQSSGINLSVSEQIQMCLILMLTSKGVAGVRGASFLILVSTVSSLGLDPHKAFAILAVDALMDMGRTTVNVIGNCLATYVVAKWEKEI